jgi:hypothetical protein
VFEQHDTVRTDEFRVLIEQLGSRPRIWQQRLVEPRGRSEFELWH